MLRAIGAQRAQRAQKDSGFVQGAGLKFALLPSAHEKFARAGGRRILSFRPLRRAQDKLREKSLLDPSHPPAMTGFRPSLSAFAPLRRDSGHALREKYPNDRIIHPPIGDSSQVGSAADSVFRQRIQQFPRTGRRRNLALKNIGRINRLSVKLLVRFIAGRDRRALQ